MRENIIKAIEENKIIAIMRGVEPEKAVKVARALSKGGIKLVEVTFNQKSKDGFKDTLNAIQAIKENCPDMIVGAGTVLSIKQVDLAKQAGATYIVSPDADEDVIAYTVKCDMVSLPGAYTATEAKRAHNAGADFVKLFPCIEGSIAYLKAMKAPLSHIKFLAVGGVNVDNAKAFIDAGAVGIGVGSSLINKELIEREDWKGLTQLAKNFVEQVK